MRPNKIIAIIFVFFIALGLAYKAAKKIHHHMVRPKLYQDKDIIARLPDAPAAKKGLRVFAASSLDRIFQNGQTLQKPSFSTTVNIASAKNAHEDFQIVVDSPDQDQPDVFLETSDLVNTQTHAVIPKSNFTWRVVGFVPTLTPYYPVKFVGPWPDPLLVAKTYTVKKGQVQPFWMDVYVPPDAQAGDYTGTVTIGGSAFPDQKMPVKLHVYNFALPKESHLKTAFDFYGQETKIRYPQGENESGEAWSARIGDINDKFIIDMLEHRMNPILNIDPTSQPELASIDRYRIYGLNNFAIGKHGGTFNNNWPKDNPSIDGLLDTYRTYGEDLNMNHLLEYTYIYTWDEGSMDNPVVPKIAAMIHKAYPGLKNMVCYHGLWDPDVNPDWGKDIDIWTFQIDDFNEAKFRKLQQRGMEMWMYVSGPSGATSPNLALDFDSIDYRILPWICWKYDIRGFLYWCVNWWPDPAVDPFKNARNSQWEQNGNGLLFYPGPNGPLDSIRTENFRDGMQDYEYIQILLNKLQVLRSQGLEQKYKRDFDQSIKLLTMDDSLVKSMWEFTKDGDYLKSRRDAIAMQIEKINQEYSK